MCLASYSSPVARLPSGGSGGGGGGGETKEPARRKQKRKTGVLVFLRLLANTSLLPLPLFHAARLCFLRGVTIIIAAELDDRENAAAVTLSFRSRTSPGDASLVTASFLNDEISFRFSDASLATHPLRISSSFHRFPPAPSTPRRYMVIFHPGDSLASRFF